MNNLTVKLRLETAIQKVAANAKKLSNSEQAGQHLGKAVKHAGRGISQWAHDNPKIATALGAGAAGLALGKRLSRR